MHKPPLGALRPPSHRTLLVDAMRELTQGQGFAATTVDEVCERAGVTKGSFYHHFASKDELGVAALQAYFDDVLGAFKSGDWSTRSGPVAQLHAFVAHAANVCSGPTMRGGCLLGAFALEQAGTVPATRELLSSMFGELRCVVAGLILAASEPVGRTVRAEALAEEFLAIVEGAVVLAKAHADPDLPRRLLACFDEHLSLLLG
ncbi:MAG TPA: TetR/AcrR family transcriptional regulator [Sporichthyaceae bacterium]